jgi:hypothetical protein
MLTNINQTSLLILKINKSYFFSKFNNYNYFFLTNNFFLLNFFFNFISINSSTNYLILNFKTRINKIKIIKNNYFFLKNLIKYRKYFHFFLNLFKFKFKFNSFFKFALLNKKFNKTIKRSFNFNFNLNTQSLYIRLFKISLKKWNFLIGNSISPLNIDLISRKKWLRKNSNIKFSKTRAFYSKKKKRVYLNTKILNKKFYINNFFYLFKDFNNINYSQLSTNIKSLPQSSFFKKKNYDFFLSRPYLFLNLSKKKKISKDFIIFYLLICLKNILNFLNTLNELLKYTKSVVDL